MFVKFFAPYAAPPTVRAATPIPINGDIPMDTNLHVAVYAATATVPDSMVSQ